MQILLFVIVFLFLFWLITTKFPKFSRIITNTGDKCYHSVVDKNHKDKEGNEISILDIIKLGFKKFGKWFKGLFHKKDRLKK